MRQHKRRDEMQRGEMEGWLSPDLIVICVALLYCKMQLKGRV